MGTDPRVSDTKLYRLGPSGEVTISAEVGDAQVGETTLQLKGATTHLPPGSAFLLGKADDLRDQVLHTITTVTDVNPATNRTSVTFHLGGGVANGDFSYTVEVADPQGSAQYLIDFIFV